MSNILVTGAEGQLGQCFYEVAKEFPVYNLFFASKKTLDITKKESLEKVFQHRSFEGIINCAAYADVDQAEIEFKEAYEINEHGIQNLVTLAEKKKIFVVHFSTDHVFEGNERKHFNEEDTTNPVNSYSLSKLAGENILRDSNCVYTIFRISWLFSPFGNNFVKTILKLSKRRDQIKVVNDQLGSPTYGIDLARVVLEKLIQPRFFDFDCYHFTNKGEVSRFEFAKKIIEISKKNCSIKPCLTKDFSRLASRPKYSVLETKRIENHFSLSISSWQNALARCLNKYNLNELI